MTEFQTATLAYQAAALSYQYAALWVSGGVGAAQCLLIGSGLWLMHRGMQSRDKQHAETVAAQERRHAEYMASHDETMKVLNANVAALEKQGEALRVVVERTRPGRKD